MLAHSHGSSWQTFVACLLACSGPRDEASEACGGAGLGRMMEVSRKKWKRRWPALTECHGPSIAQHLVEDQETPCFSPSTATT
jgi:hypothetical protein